MKLSLEDVLASLRDLYERCENAEASVRRLERENGDLLDQLHEANAAVSELQAMNDRRQAAE